MRKLWLHIGSHKTGTTSIQGALNQAHRSGHLRDLTYLNADKMNGNTSLVSTSGEGADFSPKIRWQAMKRVLPGAGDAILSSEGFFWLEGQGQINRLAKLIRAEFDEINIIAYLRRQDLLALSHRKQVAYGLHAARFYGVSISALPAWQPHFDGYFDYAAKLALWENAFGRDAMHVRRYHRADLKDGDAVADFFDLIGQGDVAPEKYANPPLSRSQLLVALKLQTKGYDWAAIKKLMPDLPDDGALLPGRAEAAAFLAHCDAANRRLAQRYDPDGPAGYFDTDMSKYPETGNDDFAGLESLISGM